MFPTSLRSLGHSTSQSKPALPEDLFAVCSAGGTGGPPSSESSSADACISGLGPQVSRLEGRHPLQDGGEHPLPLPELLSSVPCGASRSCPGGAGGLEQRGWSRPGAGAAACPLERASPLSSPAAALINIKPFSGEINYPPTARENSRDKLSC